MGTVPEGENPIGNFTVELLGTQSSSNSASRRDLGFTGQLGGKWYAVYGDVLWCASGVTHPSEDTEGFHGMVRNAVSALTDDPLVVEDLHLNDDEPVPHQKQFMPFNEDATGVLYYLVNDNEHYKGAGVAKIELVDDAPTVTDRYGDHDIWWNGDELPKYGDVAAYRDVSSEYIYILGNPPNNIAEFPDNKYVYMARVRACDAFDLDMYEYWCGREQGWKSEPLTECNCETAVMWGVGQGQIVYNKYFETYFYVHLDLGGTVFLKTAPSPEGPWAEGKEIFKDEPIDGGLVYAGVAYPHLDEPGETLTIGFTNNNWIRVIKVNFTE
ncbi:hypothetical protein FPOAC2_14411 [Fusarium poae]